MDNAFDTLGDEPDDATDETVLEAAEGEDARVGEIKTVTLDALAEMRAVGMNFIRRLDKRAAGKMDEDELKGMERVGDDCVAFERMARAVRQIVALEQETVGIRPMPNPGAGSAARRPGGEGGGGEDGDEGGGANDNPARRAGLRTGSTRGARNDLRDTREEERHAAREKAFVAGIARVVAAADLDLKAAGLGAEAAKQSPLARITAMIYAVPRPHFEACLQAMSLEPFNAGTGALIRSKARPGAYTPPHKPPDKPP